MGKPAAAALLWIPRVVGILVSLFVGMFALDAFGDGTPLVQSLPDFFIHLIPAFVLLAIVAASFRRPWIGAIIFISLAVLYALTMSQGRLDWILTISGPLLLVGALYLWSWLHQNDRSFA